MMSQSNLARQLQMRFDSLFSIPFIVTQIDTGSHMGFDVYPADTDREYGFGLEIRFTAFRISIKFIPGKFSAHMIRQMGNSSTEKRLSFVSYYGAALNERGEMNLLINEIPPAITDFKQWPTDWYNFELRLTRMPIVSDDHDEVDYLKVAEHWGGYMLGMILSLLDVVPLDDEQQDGYSEGGAVQVQSNRYERNPLNRTACILVQGCTCKVCNMNFLGTYGELGSGFIHVHHTTPVSQLTPGYIIDPLTDLVPVCPNCHAMLHNENPPLSVNRLKEMMESFESTKIE